LSSCWINASMETIDLTTDEGGTLSIYSVFIKYQKFIWLCQTHKAL
jgi:hypothetical protein